MTEYPSKLLEEAVNELSKLPGVGRKTALRLALHLLKEDKKDVELLGNALIKMSQEVKYCKTCHNISDKEICDICSNPARDHTKVCVVEDVRDVMAIENTSQYQGVYHVLGGIISPMDGIGPSDLSIEALVNRIRNNGVNELILALPTTMEGDTTNFYIYKQIKELDLKITTIARGISFGDELEYADEVTLGRSIVNRTLYKDSLSE
ncbi:MAG: recombination mediator RecR [Bacteroidales bacterium]|nr:recombination mediator RecR [Bacteroidales bacterium]